VFGLALLIPAGAGAAESKKITVDLQKGYQLSKKLCMSCHDSAANPEAGRKTRDEWYIVIDIMHKQFQMKMNNKEMEMLVDYFYSVRKGMEKDPG
jgi:hypothetical protein